MPITVPNPASTSDQALREFLHESTVNTQRLASREIYKRLDAIGVDEAEFYHSVGSFAPFESELWSIQKDLRDSGASPVPTLSAKTGLRLLQAQRLVPDKVVRSVEDGVALFFRRDARRVQIECLVDETVNVLMYSDAGPIDVLDYPDVASFGETGISEVSRFLGAAIS